ncbi:hypothetical protein PCANC_28726 [Puccinia coronata f. sp. avenae]|uniref:Uncharacterized protein n=1 Tax=Puccinia coronata f. sp. avenae TaxID=200324 RepID=A0A2N5RZ35_9BASI|nr:hypothetical protein PCANC_28726 [Puccinia coronata f. sp. avenae]
MPTDFLAFHFPQVSTSHLPAILNRFIHHSSYSMALNRTPNHPAYMSGLFETLGEVSAFNDKAKDFKIWLTTNTALNNLLDHGSIHFLSGKFMPLNDGSVPMLTYMQEAAAVACPSGAQPFSFTNKATVNSLGLVVSRKELVLESVKGMSHLAERCLRQFNIKYIGPGTKLHVKTFGLYVVGRELKVVGRLLSIGKGKAAATHNRPPKEVDTDSNSDKFDEESEPEVKPKPRGRPRKDVLKDAAKRMKKA